MSIYIELSRKDYFFVCFVLFFSSLNFHSEALLLQKVNNYFSRTYCLLQHFRFDVFLTD